MVQLDYAASGPKFGGRVTWSCAKTFGAILAQQHCNQMERSWSKRKLELNTFYQVGFKKISLLVKSKLTGVSSDEVTPRSSTGHTLMGLHCIHRILKQNLRIQSQSPEQKLCYKARWFYGIVTSRPFTYFEPSASRSSGASLNRIVENLCSCIIKLIPWAKWNVTRHFCWFPTMFELIWYHQQTLPSMTVKSLRFSKNLYVCPHGPWPTHLCRYVKTKIMYLCLWTWKRESMYLPKKC